MRGLQFLRDELGGGIVIEIAAGPDLAEEHSEIERSQCAFGDLILAEVRLRACSGDATSSSSCSWMVVRDATVSPYVPAGRDDLGRGYVLRPMVTDRLGGED